MTDINKFHEWVETQSPLALREYMFAQAAWKARGELDEAELAEWKEVGLGHDENARQAIKQLAELTAKNKEMEAKLDQDPVLYIDGGGLDGHATWAQAIRCQDTDIALYTTPSREWQSLSDEEIGRLAVFDGLHHVEIPLLAKFIIAIDKALRKKNELFGNSG